MTAGLSGKNIRQLFDCQLKTTVRNRQLTALTHEVNKRAIHTAIFLGIHKLLWESRLLRGDHDLSSAGWTIRISPQAARVATYSPPLSSSIVQFSTVNRLLKVITHLLLVVLHIATSSVLPYSAAGRSGSCQCGAATPSGNACCCRNAADRNPVPSSSACCSGVPSPGSTCCKAATAHAADVADSPILTVCGCCPHESSGALCVSDPRILQLTPQVCGAPGQVTHRFVGSLEAGLEAAAPEPPPPQQLANATMHCKELC